MLELRNPESEILDLLATGEPGSGQPSLDGLVPASAEALELRAPRGDRVPDGVAHRVSLHADAACKVVGHLVDRLEAQRRPADAGEEQLGDRPEVVVLGSARHAPILGTVASGAERDRLDGLP